MWTVVFYTEALISRRTLLRIIPVWLVCLVAGSLMPAPVKVIMGTTNRTGLAGAPGHIVTVHRAYHMVAFGATAVLMMLVCRTRREDLAVTAGALLLGALLEYAQHLMYGAVLEWWDIRDDGWGISAAFILMQTAPLRSWLVSDLRGGRVGGGLPLGR